MGETSPREEIEKKICTAKRAARSELSISRREWCKNGYAHSNVLSTDGLLDVAERTRCQDLSVSDFVKLYEQPRLPVVITGLADAWPAKNEWTEHHLEERFGQHRFKVGTDDDGYAVRLELCHFLHYMQSPNHALVDDSPLYIFDATFGDRHSSRSMLNDYKIPPYFREDLFQFAGKHRRPPHRWFVMGPARSGSSLHIDPLATNAWNTLIKGRKRWALFPPGTPKKAVLPSILGVDSEAVSWFYHVYPYTQSADWPTAKPIDIIQEAGETVFVPGGWWHAVLNLETTIAVTHNYASSSNFLRVWKHSLRSRPKMSAKWLLALRQQRSDLAAIAQENRDRDCLGAFTHSSTSSSSSCSTSSSSSTSTSTSSSSTSSSSCSSSTSSSTSSTSTSTSSEGCPNSVEVADDSHTAKRRKTEDSCRGDG
ncbi:unnamed protein product [Ostreobium quekettii]|uniref:JmjC domain-containing protein n=1 Tax=Ostreobium quekettii TaxID=121088 RepID=A0A8S1IVJ6_9CHLO|nr:unnamed protein product [Ostreobium quekettii]